MNSRPGLLVLLMLPVAGLAAQAAAEEEPAVITSPSAAPRTSAAPATTAAPASAPSATAPAATTGQGPVPATLRSSPAVVPDASATALRAPGNRGSADRIDLGATQITGNSELPRVLYVVPWKRAELGDLAGRPAKSLLDEVLTPVDRDVFRRQNRYYEALHPDVAGTAPEGEK